MRYDWDEKPELNITPLVDVMLVLLAILMVIAPTIIFEEIINLPQGSTQKELTRIPPVNITINAKGEVSVNRQKYDYNAFVDNFYLYSKTLDKKATVMISADRNIDYGRVMRVLGAVKTAGFAEVSLATNG